MSMSKVSKRLEQLEREIESGVRSIGKALMEIRNSKAYLHINHTFEDYCKERWGFTDRHARRIIDAEAVRIKIGHFCPVEMLKTQHLLELSKVPPAKQAQLAASVIAECQAENRQPTTKDYKAAAKEFVEPKPEPKDVTENVWKDVLATSTSERPADAWEDVDDEPEAKPEPTIKERVSGLKSMVKQHNAAMMRAIDDLNTVQPNKLCHDTAHKSFRAIHEVIEAWR